MTEEASAGRMDGAELVTVLYDEMRRLAAARMARIPRGNTLQPTALVHEAYMRLVTGPDGHGRLWDSRGHFFGAASQAMRQILVDQARRKAARKHGGEMRRVDADEVDLAIDPPEEDVLALNRALERLEKEDPRKAEIALLRSFGGLDREEVAAALGLSVRTIDREWRYLRAWLHREIQASRDALS
ncbi:MAG: ECF-type sigma factor [Candidatus Eisenbacteria bacterium]|nr:ECF-type sigma factor [Candidatus Eisenbacteria bacterium]